MRFANQMHYNKDGKIMNNVDQMNELKARLGKCITELDNLIQTMTKELEDVKNDDKQIVPEVPC
jgi:hypothetical protein